MVTLDEKEDMEGNDFEGVEEVESEDDKDDDDLIEEDDDEEYYECTMIPECNADDKETGVTFKGDTTEYLSARDIIFDLFNKKGLKMSINNRKMRILDNAKNKPIKIEVKSHKGVSGKVNITIFKPNKSGSATIMIQKTKDAELVHVKTLAFKIVKYLIDGIIDEEIKEDDLNGFKESENENLTKKKLYCDICEKDSKTNSGTRIHIGNLHGIQREICCETCGKVLKTKKGM